MVNLLFQYEFFLVLAFELQKYRDSIELTILNWERT